MRKQYKKEPKRCVCMAPGMTDEQHHKPHNQAGKHLDTACPHSEMYTNTVIFQTEMEAKAAERKAALRARLQKERGRNRKVIKRVEL